jgi:hypothetical protein
MIPKLVPGVRFSSLAFASPEKSGLFYYLYHKELSVIVFSKPESEARRRLFQNGYVYLADYLANRIDVFTGMRYD